MTMYKRIFLAMLIFVLPLSALNAQTGNVNGEAVNQATGDPLNSVNLLLYQAGEENEIYRNGITDISGRFTFKDIPYGEYVLAASHVGFQKIKKRFHLNEPAFELEVAMEEQQIDLGEVVVSSLHQERQVKQVSMPMEVLSEPEAEMLATFSPAEALEQEPGIAMQSDGVWATSVNIRGLNEQRIVALVDGNRIETATDLAAGLSMIDMSDVQQIEVIKGAASSIYGSGAMGGVVNFITKTGHFSSNPYTHGELATSFQSVNELVFRKLAITTGNDFGYLRVSGMARNAADIKTPEGILPNSQFKDNNISVDAGLKTLKNHTLKMQFQRFFAEDVGIPGGAPFPGPAEATYPEEKRTLYSAEYTIEDLLPSLDEFSLKYFHQYILRDVLMKPNTPPQRAGNFRITPEKVTPQGKHHTDGLKMKTQWDLGEGHDVIAGIDLWQRKLNTSREKQIRQEVLDPNGNPLDTIQIIRGEKPIPESSFGSGGLFIQDEFTPLEDLKVTIGGRYDLVRVRNEQAYDPEYLVINGERQDPPPNQRITFEEQTVYNKSWSANLGMLYNISEDLDLTLTLGRSFRSPALEERYKYIDLGNKVRIGDPELQPEDGYTVDAGFRVWKPEFNFRINGFVNRFSDMIVEKPGNYIYEYSAGPQAGTKDTLPALINSNVDRSLLYGFDMKMELQLTNRLVFYGSASFVRGKDIKNDENLPLIPPLNGRAGFKYRFNENLNMDVYSSHYKNQDKEAEGETETPGYSVYNLTVYTRPIDLDFVRLKLSGGVENIFDRAYRNHLSTNRGVVKIEPGRNLFLKAKLQF